MHSLGLRRPEEALGVQPGNHCHAMESPGEASGCVRVTPLAASCHSLTGDFKAPTLPEPEFSPL